MGKELKRLSKRKKTTEEIERISKFPADALVIHYSCESFFDRDDGKTPRATSIAVRNLESAQTESFSIHKIAEQEGKDFKDIINFYDELEKKMLEEFFTFLTQNKDKRWIHWNMRDINYGFIALEHRFKALQGNPTILPENKKFDLARAMTSLYGSNYVEHPRLVNLVKKNGITDRGMLIGEDEAIAFENKEYVKLHQSTLRKVDIIANIFERTAEGALKTDSKWFEKYNLFHPKLALEYIKEHWIYSLLGLIIFILSLLRPFGILEFSNTP